MILLLIAWMYISFICLVWGNMLLGLSIKGVKFSSFPLSPFIICFSGLALIGMVSFYLSLFLPLSLIAHIIIILPVLIYMLFRANRIQLKNQFTEIAKGYSPVTAFLAAGSVLTLLVISSYNIIHPDTLSYHAQSIRWMEQYKAVPGTVHIDHEVAMQSTWFAVQAIFRFNFIYPNNFLFVNGCVVCWFCLFVCSRIHLSNKNLYGPVTSKTNPPFAWLLLLAFGFISWTQVRLTAISASPDFIASLCIWTACYFFLKSRDIDKSNIPLGAVFFCSAAVAVKLSAFIILLLPAVGFAGLLLKRKYVPAIIFATTGALVLLPTLIRNVIASGYPLFPSGILNIFGVDWKIDATELHQFQQYIFAYARVPVESYRDAEALMQAPLSQWIGPWWKSQPLVDQLLLAIIPVFFVLNLITLKKQVKQRSYPEGILLLVLTAGILFWFINAPAPRFGTGYLVPLVYLLGIGVFPSKNFSLKPAFLKPVVLVCSLLLLLYTGYRLIYFFEPMQAILPAGIKKMDYREVTCDGVVLYQAAVSNNCGFMPAPSISDSCRHFELRGDDISAGFKKRQ